MPNKKVPKTKKVAIAKSKKSDYAISENQELKFQIAQAKADILALKKNNLRLHGIIGTERAKRVSAEHDAEVLRNPPPIIVPGQITGQLDDVE
jgi:hypothetical protein